MSQPPIFLVVALPAEAKPLIAYYHLSRQSRYRTYPVYQQEGINLVVSGVGKAKAAAATLYLQSLETRPAPGIWLNLGIAGHPSMAIGEAFVAREIRDTADGLWRPDLSLIPRYKTESLVTLGQADFAYQGKRAVDMEAAGFYPAACQFSSPQWVQSIKVVSDNRDQPGHGIKAKTVSQLIDNNVLFIDDLVQHLTSCAQGLG